MAAAASRALASAARPLGGALLRSVPFALYRSGTSRGVYVLEEDVPPAGLDRDVVLCQLMGSGHPQQLEGLGGASGPTSKAVVVGKHAGDPGCVTYTFAQCRVEDASVDHSHGDCGNMLAAVGPFALERGLVAFSPAGSPSTTVQVHSLNTGAVYTSEVLTEGLDGERGVKYTGDFQVPGVPSPGAPVAITSHGVAGAQTGRLLPTGSPWDTFGLGPGLGVVRATVVDFSRALVVLDAREVLPQLGVPSLAAIGAGGAHDARVDAALETVRLQAALAAGMGDCSGKDAPKVALLAPASGGVVGGGATVECRYWVNPGRNELHPTVALTAAQAIAAAAFVDGGIVRSMVKAGAVDGRFELTIRHAKGDFVVAVRAAGCCCEGFPDGLPDAGELATTVRPLAEGRAFL